MLGQCILWSYSKGLEIPQGENIDREIQGGGIGFDFQVFYLTEWDVRLVGKVVNGGVGHCGAKSNE